MIDLKYYIPNKINKKNDNVAFHYHKFYEFTFYDYGSGVTEYIQSNDTKNTTVINETISSTFVHKESGYKKLSFSDKSLIIYPPFTIHNKIHNGPANIFAFVFDITDPDMSFDCQVIENLPMNIQKLFNMLVDEYKRKEFHYKEMIGSILEEICIKLKRFLNVKNSIQDNPIEETMMYIDDYFLTDINFDELAKNYGYSPDRFRHIFKEKTGLAPKQFILNKRMEYAKEQISHTKTKITYIAESCGYTNYIQFSTYFKKKYGLSPKEYREKNKTEELK